jgi:hypothetical protein
VKGRSSSGGVRVCCWSVGSCSVRNELAFVSWCCSAKRRRSSQQPFFLQKLGVTLLEILAGRATESRAHADKRALERAQAQRWCAMVAQLGPGVGSTVSPYEEAQTYGVLLMRCLRRRRGGIETAAAEEDRDRQRRCSG